MKKIKLDQDVINKSDDNVQEMEQYISVLEEQTDLQKQLIDHLKKENNLLLRQLNEYKELIHKMLGDIH